MNRNRSTIIVPAGSSGEEGWELFRNLLAEINEAVTPSFYPVPNQVLLTNLLLVGSFLSIIFYSANSNPLHMFTANNLLSKQG